MNKMAQIEQIIKDTPQGEDVYHELRKRMVEHFAIPLNELEKIGQLIWNLTPDLSLEELDELPRIIRKYHPDFPFKSFSAILWWSVVQACVAQDAKEELSHGGLP